MLPEDGTRLVWLSVLVLIVGLIGVSIIIALLSSWRNQTRRDRLLDQGKRLRAEQHPHPQPSAPDDAWREAGRRYRDDDDDIDVDNHPGRDRDKPG